MAKWFCSIKPSQDVHVVMLETEDEKPRAFDAVVEADMAWDAKAFAGVMLGRLARSEDARSDPTLIVSQTGDDAVADYSLRWVGSDAGTHPNRRMQVRAKGEDVWKDWNPTQ